MVLLNKNSIKLPRVDKETFMLLVRSFGLEYNQSQRTYSITRYNSVEKLVDTISNILNAEKVMFLQSCTLCGKDFPCSDCKYYDSCATKDLPFHCVCPKCLKGGKSYDEYAENSEE